MTDADFEAAQAASVALEAESDRLWQLRMAAVDAWYQHREQADKVRATIEQERQRRIWEAEFRAAAAQETAA